MKDPAFLFYPGDWNLGTMHMTHTEKGAYMDLLMLQFARGKFTLAHAKHMLNGSFDLVWATVVEKFKTDGQYYWNERLETEKEKRSKFTDSRRNNAKSIKINNNKTKDMQEHKKEHMPIHMENENENENKDIIEVMEDKSVRKETIEIIHSSFEEFRSKYPGTKRGYKTEFENFQKKHKDWREIMPTLTDLLQDQIHSKEIIFKAGGFVPEWKNMQTYINQRAWEETFKTNIHETIKRNNKGATKEQLAELFAKKWKDPSHQDLHLRSL